MTLTKVINGKRVEMSEEEEAETRQRWEESGETAQEKEEQLEKQKKQAYINEVVPLFIQAQDGDIDPQEWKDKKAEIDRKYSTKE